MTETDDPRLLALDRRDRAYVEELDGDEREVVVSTLARYRRPVLVDGMDDAVSEAFAAWPERLYVAEPGGRLVYVGGPGPFEFDPDEAATALAELMR